MRFGRFKKTFGVTPPPRWDMIFCLSRRLKEYVHWHMYDRPYRRMPYWIVLRGREGRYTHEQRSYLQEYYAKDF